MCKLLDDCKYKLNDIYKKNKISKIYLIKVKQIKYIIFINNI